MTQLKVTLDAAFPILAAAHPGRSIVRTGCSIWILTLAGKWQTAACTLINGVVCAPSPGEPTLQVTDEIFRSTFAPDAVESVNFAP